MLNGSRNHPILRPIGARFVLRPTDVECWQYDGCAGAGSVGFCMYDGSHGDWPEQPRADNLVWSFFTNVSATAFAA